VVEGVGDHGCEYMTGGVVVVLGETGRNFGAGMTGGIAYVLDEKRDFSEKYNPQLVSLEPVMDDADLDTLLAMIRRHAELTGSERAGEILSSWDSCLPLFWKVIPHPIEAPPVRPPREKTKAEEPTAAEARA